MVIPLAVVGMGTPENKIHLHLGIGRIACSHKLFRRFGRLCPVYDWFAAIGIGCAASARTAVHILFLLPGNHVLQWVTADTFNSIHCQTLSASQRVVWVNMPGLPAADRPITGNTLSRHSPMNAINNSNVGRIREGKNDLLKNFCLAISAKADT
jgi:hypothetical protein